MLFAEKCIYQIVCINEWVHMKILTRDDIIKRGTQLLDPFGGKPCLTAVGYDLRVGENLWLLNLGKPIKLRPNESVDIPPRERFAVESLEKVRMKDNMVALIATRISLLWKGLTSLGTKIDPMFQDKLTLIFSNDSDTPLTLDYGQRICNVIFFEYENPPKDLELRKRPTFMPPEPAKPIEEPIALKEIQRKYGLAVASIFRYLRPRLREHERKLRTLEKFKTSVTSVLIAAISTFIISLIIWFLTHPS